MAEQIKIKKNMIFGVIGVIVIGVFLGLAFRNIFNKDNDVNSGELVKGGEAGSNKVTVDGNVQVVNLGISNYNYDPSTFTVESGKPVKIVGNMNQLQGCLKSFKIPQLGLSKLFRDGDNVLEFTPTQKGTFGYTCVMGMGKGSFTVL